MCDLIVTSSVTVWSCDSVVSMYMIKA